jgi:hypothetical protein
VLDETDPRAESDLRRRAAWLLAMLAVVAVLFIVVMTLLINGKGGKGSGSGPAALDSLASSPDSSPTHSSSHAAPTRSHSSSSSASSSAPPTGSTSCPGAQPCVLTGDIGNGVNAINAYRTQHGQPAVPGSVGSVAQTCAVHNGNGCTGGWAETELATPDGQEAVQKILPFAKLLDPALKNFQVGWAYDPGAKLYYFAIIRND